MYINLCSLFDEKCFKLFIKLRFHLLWFQNMQKKLCVTEKNPNEGGQAGLEPAVPRRVTRPNPDVGSLLLSHHRLDFLELQGI